MYALVLFVHSWLRWLVLFALLGGLVRFGAGLGSRRAWTKTDKRWLTIATAALDTQMLLGVLLYFVLSPITPTSLDQLRAQMPVAPLRFFAVEHVTAMLLALIAAHVTAVRSKRAPDDRTRFRRAVIGFALTLLLVCVGIPWPGSAAGRPLFRGF
jgi:hypothetical protein